MTPLKSLSLTLLLSLSLTSCGTRTIVVPPGTTVVNTTEVKSTAIVPDKNGDMVPATITIPIGAIVTTPEKDITTRKTIE